MQLVLASSSKSRAAQISQLQINFQTYAPDIDESAKENESAEQLVLRLATEKAKKVASIFPNSVIIAGDQVHKVGNKIHGKPHDYETARNQLSLASGQKTQFLSGIAVLNTNTNKLVARLLVTEVTFKTLTAEEINKYLEIDQPFECAGSIRIEGLAPCLISEIKTPDPTAITGMPLIVCCEMLAAVGFDCLKHAHRNS